MKMKELAALPLAMLAAGAFAAKGPEKISPLGGDLAPVAAEAGLRADLDRFGFTAYRYPGKNGAYACLLYLPAKGSRKLPLVVHIPGSGEKGDLAAQFGQEAIFRHVTSAAFQKAHPCGFVSVCPPYSVTTLTGGAPGRPNEDQSLIHDMVFEIVRQSGRIDPTRIYLTGFSYGGSGVYSLALNYPGVFAATVAISSLPPLPEYFSPQAPGNWWHIYNELDYERVGMEVEPIRWFRDRVNAAGGDFRISSFPSEGHDAWTKTWMEDSIWKWMFTKKTGKPRRPAPGASKAKSVREVTLSRAKCTASVAGRDRASGPERAADGLDDTVYAPERAFTADDWWMIEFDKPVCGRFELFSGDREGIGRLKRAFVEVSENGRRWTRVATFSDKDGCCRFVRTGSVRYLRVRTAEPSARFVLRRISVSGF